jgi:hypothetical protein
MSGQRIRKGSVLALALLVLLLQMPALHAQAVTTSQQFQNQVAGAALDIANNWQALAILALMASAAIVGIGYAVGRGFEIPELEAWAASELSQIIVNAVIIAVLLAAMIFIDGLVVAMVSESQLPTFTCTAGQSCLQLLTDNYLSDYVNASEAGAENVLQNNVAAAEVANRRFGGYCTSIYCLEAGYSMTDAGEKVLDQDYYAIIFEYYSSLLSFLQAQLFFVHDIAFKMAPVVLAIGIVGRSFFPTRKIGGLLMAVAIGAMLFFPLMYLFDWVTLDTTLTGDKDMDSTPSTCPAECARIPPIAYYYYNNGVLGTINDSSDMAAAFVYTDTNDPDGLLNGSMVSATGSNGTAMGQTVTSCINTGVMTTYGDAGLCPQTCRVLPYPSGDPGCAMIANQTLCALLAPECKINRIITVPTDTAGYAQYVALTSTCPESCKVVPPMKSNCTNGTIDPATGNDTCLESRFDCRIADLNNLSARPAPAGSSTSSEAELCADASSCVASLVANQSCVYVMPEQGICDDLCPACPAYCRLDGGPNLNDLPPDSACINSTSGTLIAACTACIADHDSCAVNVTAITALKTELDADALAQSPPGQTGCDSCPAEMRLTGSDLPSEYTSQSASGDCSLDDCPAQYRLQLPSSTCEACLSVPETYTYDPPLQTDCGSLCGPPQNVPAASPQEFEAIGASGMVGKPEMQSLAALMLPAYVLPLFNIVATLVFILSLSALLGGDIEIPGLSKVF